MERVTVRLALGSCLVAAMLSAAALSPAVSSARSLPRAVAAPQSRCATAGAPSLFPYGPDEPPVFTTSFATTRVPARWWVPPTSTTFNQYTVHAPDGVDFNGSELQLTNQPDRDGTQQDMGIAGESPLLETSGVMPDGLHGDSLLVAWCARITSDPYIDTDFELGQASSKPWPPEIDLAEGAGNALTVILHWTCDASIAGCPRVDGTFNGTVARTGPYKPWPPPGVKVGDHYTCDDITNAKGQQVTNDPSDGHYDYNCRAEIPLALPRGASVSQWNEYGAAFDPSNRRFSVWVDGQRPVTVTDRVCGEHLLYDDNGVLPIGENLDGGASEPCLQAIGNWQFDVQQTEWMGRKTVPGLTPGEFDTADVAWFADYAYAACPPQC